MPVTGSASESSTGASAQDPAQHHLSKLSESECWEMLAGGAIGRLVWAGAEGLSAVPVNYLVVDGVVVVRTAAHSELALESDDSLVAFQADHIDEGARTGWSVLLRGRAHIDYGVHHDQPEAEVWPSGPRPLRVRIEATSISGRRLLSS